MEEWTVTYDTYMLEKLDHIANYIANELDDTFGAQKVLDSVKKETQKLAIMPLRFPPLPVQQCRKISLHRDRKLRHNIQSKRKNQNR